MNAKPTQTCRLVADKLIGGQPNFVATFNWIVSCLENFAGDDEKTITIQGINQGRPKLKIEKPEEIEVVTGISFELSNGTLSAKIEKKKVKILGEPEDASSESVDVVELEEETVVTDVEYSSSTHELTKKRRNVTAIRFESEKKNTVFTAVPHSSVVGSSS